MKDHGFYTCTLCQGPPSALYQSDTAAEFRAHLKDAHGWSETDVAALKRRMVSHEEGDKWYASTYAVGLIDADGTLRQAGTWGVESQRTPEDAAFWAMW